MRILFVGDLIGKPGRKALRALLPTIQKEQRIDFSIANVENSAGGFGITPSLVGEILAAGVDVMTSGNHIWDKRDILETLDREPRLLRPANYPPGLAGSGVFVDEQRFSCPICVINLQGRVFMPAIDCPFRQVTGLLAEWEGRPAAIIVDFHAEATSEKMALGAYLDGQVSAVIGTHTHVPTADSRVLPGGTAYVTDAGMTGSFDSVIGMKSEAAIRRLLTGLPGRFEPETRNLRLCSVVVDIDEGSGQATSIKRLDIDYA